MSCILLCKIYAFVILESSIARFKLIFKEFFIHFLLMSSYLCSRQLVKISVLVVKIFEVIVLLFGRTAPIITPPIIILFLTEIIAYLNGTIFPNFCGYWSLLFGWSSVCCLLLLPLVLVISQIKEFVSIEIFILILFVLIFIFIVILFFIIFS